MKGIGRMSKSHSKKRNTGLLYEFLVRTISSALIENNQRKSTTALKILKKHFKKGTELYNEFRLINSLVRTTVSSESVAASILQEAKKASKLYNLQKLDREKSLLIRNINHKLNDDMFYDQHINEYKTYATVQSLLNDWRSENMNIQKIAMYEDQLIKWLLSEKNQIDESSDLEHTDTSGSGRLLMKLMMKKLNEKYSTSLNETQRSLVRTYVWSTSQDGKIAIKQKLIEVKQDLLNSIDEFISKNTENAYIVNKLNETKQNILNETIEEINDDTMTRFMLYVQLHNELISQDET